MRIEIRGRNVEVTDELRETCLNDSPWPAASTASRIEFATPLDLPSQVAGQLAHRSGVTLPARPRECRSESRPSGATQSPRRPG